MGRRRRRMKEGRERGGMVVRMMVRITLEVR